MYLTCITRIHRKYRTRKMEGEIERAGEWIIYCQTHFEINITDTVVSCNSAYR